MRYKFQHQLILLFPLFFITIWDANATHYRAGEILYKCIVGRTFEVTIITYTDPTSTANTSTVQIVDFDWGDGKTETIPRLDELQTINPLIKRNRYVARHTYATDGVYEIGLLDRNRVGGIVNINNGFTSEYPFFVSSKVLVSSSIGNNQSPILQNPPIDRGCKGFLFFHDPAAYDPDGDSMVFALIPPKIGPGEDAPNYHVPSASDSFSLNSRTGRLVWAHPLLTGFYNIAIEIREFRTPQDGQPPYEVGRVVRDMQIYIDNCTNSPPELEPMGDKCVRVGQTIKRVIRATEPNPGQSVSITGISQPFYFTQNPATLTFERTPRIGYDTILFKWTPYCYNIRYESYPVKFRAVDNYEANPLADYNGFYIKVIGPEPANVQAIQTKNDAFSVSWRKDSCNLAAKYDVYRRIDSSHWNPDSCQRGIPAYTGFVKIGEKDPVNFPNDTVFIDDDNHVGLSPLIRYCYRVVSVYPARNELGAVIGGRSSESYASAEVCNVILRSKPIITKASVNYTDSLNGSIQLNWLRPDTLDTSAYKAPYRLVFKHGTSISNMTQFAEAGYLNFNDIKDSSLVDTMLNTKHNQYYYQIELHAQLANVDVKADESPVASSVKANIYSTDNTNILSWYIRVPWMNDTFVVERKNSLNVFEEVGRTTANSYSDTGLVNNQNYCYRIQSIGAYPLLPLTILNYSQEICGTPVDTVPPCPPLQTVVPPCSDFTHYENVIKWTTNGGCDDDVIKYNIYYKLQKDDEFIKIATVPNTVFTYTDSREILKKSIAGCYVVTGVDSFDNESSLNAFVCIDNCPQYTLPNVFTPNGDNLNDIFKPFQYRFIDRIELMVYNRWGDKVFSTNDIDINWDGTDSVSGKPLGDGIYFYVCQVYEQYLDGLKKRTLKGTIQIIH